MESSKQEWIHNPEFDDPSQSHAILAEMPGEEVYSCSDEGKPAPDWHDELDVLPVLTQEQEKHLFRKMNFLKCRAARPDAEEGDLEAARLIRERLVRANLRLLFKVLKRHGSKAVAWDDLVSDGECALWRAVEKFDYARGLRFSTFAYRVIRHRLGEKVQVASKKRAAARLVDEFQFDTHPDQKSVDPMASELAATDLEPLLKRLPLREKQVLCLRHGLGENESLSLTEVGEELGLSKTRVRQLEQQAYAKLRQFTQLAAC